MDIEDFPEKGYITINGFRYSYDLFNGLTMVTREDRALRITNVEDGVVTIEEKVVDEEFWK